MIAEKNKSLASNFVITLADLVGELTLIKEFTLCYNYTGADGTGTIITEIQIDPNDNVWEALDTYSITETSDQVVVNCKYLCSGVRISYTKGTMTEGTLNAYIILDGEQ